MSHFEFRAVKGILFDAGSTLIPEITRDKKRIKNTHKENRIPFSGNLFFALILKGANHQQKSLRLRDENSGSPNGSLGISKRNPIILASLIF